MEITLESLGLTQEEITERIIDNMVDRLMKQCSFDEDGDECHRSSELWKKLQVKIEERIDTAIEEIADKHVIPKVDTFIENLVLQQTNKWGEAKGEPVTFVEYMVERAMSYMTDKVDDCGKSKSESNTYGWSGTQTRLNNAIDRHLQHFISVAMESVLKDGVDCIRDSIVETAKIQLREVASKLKVSTTINSR
ncbi:MAG: hypothetical protein GY841_18515 [FCB group bacterium]|nr:hypothetical protein [FCB group bacterium]